MDFSVFEGNEQLKNDIDSLNRQNRMPHAVIINGGTQQGRKQLSIYLAMMAVCSGNDKPCGKCKNCINASELVHSDIYVAEGSGKTDSFSKDELKSIIRDTVVKPNQANCKVYILEECDSRFPVISQNVFLKTLEEPVQNVLFILTCDNSNILLPTIRSRATTFTLKKQAHINEEAFEIAKEIVLGIVSNSEMRLLNATYKLSDRQSSLEILSYIVLLLRDGLCVSLGAQAQSDKEAAQTLCKKLTKAQYLKLIEITQDAQNKINQNVSLKLIGTWLCAEYRRISWQR